MTSWLSTPSRLQTLPISLPKQTFSACQVLLAYLIISATRMLVVDERRVDALVERHRRGGVGRVIVADQRQRRMADVLDGAAFAQKLRVDRHAEAGSVSLARCPLERRDHRLVGRARQDRAANHDDVILDSLSAAPRRSARTRASR